MTTSQSLIKKVTDFFLSRVSEEHKLKKEIIECLLSEFDYFKLCNLNDLPIPILTAFLNIASKDRVYVEDLMVMINNQIGHKDRDYMYLLYYFRVECKRREVTAKEFFTKMFEQGDINQNFKKKLNNE